MQRWFDAALLGWNRCRARAQTWSFDARNEEPRQALVSSVSSANRDVQTLWNRAYVAGLQDISTEQMTGPLSLQSEQNTACILEKEHWENGCMSCIWIEGSCLQCVDLHEGKMI